MSRLLQAIRALFAWRTVRDSGVYLYQENAITGARRTVQYSGGYQPKDFAWLTRVPDPWVGCGRQPPPSKDD